MAKIDTENFIAKYYSDCTETKRQDVERFLNHVEALAEERNLSISEALNDETILTKTFFIQNIGGDVSRSHYQKIKKYLSDLMDMCDVSSQIPSRETVIASKDTTGLFRSLDDLLAFIDKVGEATLAAVYNPSADLVVIKTVCVLGWNKFTPTEMSELKVSNLKACGDGIYKIRKGDEDVVFTKSASDVLREMKTLDFYQSIPGGRKVYLVNSEYLLRPARSGTTEIVSMKRSSIVALLNKFNEKIPPYFGKVILLRNLRKNVYFLEIYNDKKEERLTEKVMRIMQTDRFSALSYEKQYLRFAEALQHNEL